jgi:hypothetical protein
VRRPLEKPCRDWIQTCRRSLEWNRSDWSPLMRWSILKPVKKWLDQLSLWQWSVLQASVMILVLAVSWSMMYLGHRDDWLGARWWVEFGVSWTIFYAGWTTLARYLQMRRRRKRG